MTKATQQAQPYRGHRIPGIYYGILLFWGWIITWTTLSYALVPSIPGFSCAIRWAGLSSYPYGNMAEIMMMVPVN